ncbi:MAG: DUF4340 domain-containing protein [Halioglobus sp.]
MSRAITVLLLLMLIQCGLVAVVFWPQDQRAGETAPQTLIPFATATVDELRIGDDYDNEAVLVKSGEQWLLPDLENLPADPEKVKAVLEAIQLQPGNWPIARSSAARQRFQVADYYYQRKLTLLADGEKLGTLYLGTSPGFRKVHARNEQEATIYSIPLNTFELPAVSDAWLEPRLLQLRTPLRIDADLYNLYLEDGHWLSRTGGTPDEQELETLLATLKSLKVEGVADEDLQRELSDAEADLVLNIQSLAGEVTLELVSLNGGHYIHSSEFPLFFKLNRGDYERLAGIDVSLIAGDTRSE